MSAGSRTALVAACAGVALGASLARAEPSADGLETVIATGTRLPAAAPIVASSVLDAEQIARRNDPDITELLTAVPGVYVESAGSRGSIGSLFLRGGEANFTQVFVDGVQVNDPTNTRGGSFDFAALDVDEVERIEVVRGPLSSIYGSDALAGVIQIFTNEPSAQPRWRAGYDTGGTGLWRARLGSTGGFGRASSYSVQATSEQDSQDRDSGAYRGRALSGSIGLGSGENLDIELHARHAESESRAFPDASGGPRLASLREQDSRDASDDTLGFALTTHRLDDRWQWHFDAAWFEHEEQEHVGWRVARSS